jgi:hypothetical protein
MPVKMFASGIQTQLSAEYLAMSVNKLPWILQECLEYSIQDILKINKD